MLSAQKRMSEMDGRHKHPCLVTTPLVLLPAPAKCTSTPSEGGGKETDAR